MSETSSAIKVVQRGFTNHHGMLARLPELHPRSTLHGDVSGHLVQRLSGKDPTDTLSRFGRAVGGHHVEHAIAVHPLSGRAMGMSRGAWESGSVELPTLPRSKARQKAAELAERTENPKVRNRAKGLAEGRSQKAAGPRPILAHTHPPGAETYPSRIDMRGARAARAAHINPNGVVVSRHPDNPVGQRTKLVTFRSAHRQKMRQLRRLSRATAEASGTLESPGTAAGYDHAVRSRTGAHSRGMWTHEKFTKSAFGVEHQIAKALPFDEDYHRVHQGRRDRLAAAQAADWRINRNAKVPDHAWINGKDVGPTLGAHASVRNELSRRRASRSARALGSYRERRVLLNPDSEMGRGRNMVISEYRPLHTRKRLYVAAGLAAGGTAAAIAHHKHKQAQR